VPQRAEDRLLFGPLLVGRQPRWVSRPVAADPLPGLIAGTIFAVALVALCYGIWRAGRRDDPPLPEDPPT
jgi:hypothetical protein